jgi:hypothetical protein
LSFFPSVSTLSSFLFFFFKLRAGIGQAGAGGVAACRLRTDRGRGGQ